MIVIEILLLSYLGFAAVHTLIFAIAGNFSLPALNIKEFKERRIAVFIPAYKEDEVILSTARHALKQNYPTCKFSVIVIADSLKDSTLAQLALLPIQVVQVKFEKSTKAKSLNYALAEIKEEYDIAVILDADNVMEEDFLSKVNTAYNAGYAAIQGRRVGKNMNTPFAVLDTISEVINNHIYRKGHTVLGLSSAVIGSGMAFNYELFKNALSKNNAVGGFDRELQLSFIAQKKKILYLESAVVYDEKVDKATTFSNQRKRWLASQFIYLNRNLGKGVLNLFKGNYDFFNMAILNNILLPRVLMLGIISVSAVLSILLRDFIHFPYQLWVLLWGIYVLTFLISIPAKLYNKKLWAALMSLPQAFVILFLSLFKLKGANKQFIHTPHSSVEVDKSLIN